MKKPTKLYAFSLLLILSGFCNAQQWNDKQKEVWGVILSSFKDIDKGDNNWSNKWVTKDAMVWGGSYPMPRNRDSVKRWDAYYMPQSQTLLSEYASTAIVVHGTTAVAHYYYTNAGKDKEGKHKTTYGRCTDVLAKDDGKWKFIAWHCTDTPEKD